ncbi:Similar to Oacyl: O-acyltransferase like protein (Mus musculus) [Cotesia congregata]|uniref:Similar to Oacyl: O-acyltransferase like protein (Mus musculus) n=1 Tax=Cotesia congregata TaxID=51543 RepID=A0A8J2GZK7_COTCN|nr:Similar to Oacyl: O-acyltransferase like protein (Mus musculus) [Cotesia congregata]
MSVRVVAKNLTLLILFCLFRSLKCRDTSDLARNNTFELLKIPEIYLSRNNSREAKCDGQMKIFENALQKYERWALKMLDASSKIPSGLIQGNIKDLGMYDQCIAVNVTVGNEIIRGQHCMYVLDVNINGTKMPVSLVLSACVPATCEAEQVTKKIQRLIDIASGFLDGNELQVIGATCSRSDDHHWDLVFLTFLLTCTFCDVLSRFTSINRGFFHSLCKFSLITNSQHILNTQVSENHIRVISGLRFYSVCWIMLAHFYYHTLSGSVINLRDIVTINTRVLGTAFDHDILTSEDGFRCTLENDNEHPESLLPKKLVADAPECLLHTWYLAMDMQLFWLSPLIFYPLYKKPKLGLSILFVAIIASIITPAVVVAVNKFTIAWTLAGDLDRKVDMMLYFYFVTYTHAGPWLLGVLVGYLLATDRRIPGPRVRKVGWIFTILAFMFSIFTFRIYQSEDYRWNIYWETFYAGLSQHIWAFGVCWIIYVSVLGHGGFIAKFLSLPIYIPFSRMSYSIYLIHFEIQTIKRASSRAPTYFNDAQMMHGFLGEVVVYILGGFVFSLMFELPFRSLKN